MLKTKKIKVVVGLITFVLAMLLLYIGLQALDNRDQLDLDDYDEDNLTADRDIVFDGMIYDFTHPVKSYLFIGTDNSGNENVKGDEYVGSMADFLLLLVVDEVEKKYGFIEVNRDTISDIPMMKNDGTVTTYAAAQLCNAHAYGRSKRMGCLNTVDAVSIFLKCVPIDGYYSLPMDSIGAMNDVLGGVTVTMEEDFTDIDASFTEGATVTLDGELAEKFIRSRMGVEDGENTSRMKRQRIYLNALFETIQKRNSEDQKFIAKVYKKMDEVATADINMNVVTKLAQHMDEYESLGILRIDGEVEKGDTLGDNCIHSEFYADEDSLKETILSIFPLENTGKESEYDVQY